MRKSKKMTKLDKLREKERAARPKMQGVYYKLPAINQGYWEVETTLPNGTKVRRRLNITPEDNNEVFKLRVEALRHKVLAEADATALAAKKITLSELLDVYARQREIRDITKRSMATSLRGFCLDNASNVKTFEAIMAHGYKQGSLRVKIKAIRGFFKWLRRQEGFEAIEDPTASIHKLPGRDIRKRVLTADEMATLLKHVDSYGTIQDRLFVRLLRFTGARCGSIKAVTPSSFDGERIRLIDVKCGRPYDSAIPINDATTKELWAQCVEGVEPDEKFFDARVAERLRRRMAKIFPKNEQGSLSPHSIRHTVASELITNGVPIEVVSKLLNHRNITITLQTYVTLSDDRIDSACSFLK